MDPRIRKMEGRKEQNFVLNKQNVREDFELI